MSTDAAHISDHDAAVAPDSDALAALLRAIGEGADERERNDIAPFDAVALLRDARLGAFRVPRELGGGGASIRQLFAMLIDLSEVDCNIGHLLRNHFLFSEQLILHTDQTLRERWIPRIVAGELVGNVAGELVPAAVGSPEWYAFKTKMVDEGEGFRISGVKYYATGTMYCDWVSILATHEQLGMVNATVPIKREGVIVEDDWDGIGQRLTASGTVRLENVWVNPDEIVGNSWTIDGVVPLSYFPTQQHLWLHGVIAGILRSVANEAVHALRTRTRSFSHAPTEVATDDPLLQQIVGRLASTAYAAEALVLHAAGALDAAHESAVDGVCDRDAVVDAQLRVAEVKVHLDGLATEAAAMIFDVAAGSATSRTANLDRHWRNLRTIISHNPAVYKAQAIGDHLVNGTPFSANGYF